MCTICFCDMTPEEATAMDCGHSFCNDCWKQHARIQIQEGQSRRLKCMAPKCGAHCDEDKVTRIARSTVLCSPHCSPRIELTPSVR